MKFIYQDILNLLSDKPSIELLSEKLFQLGHEHEIIDNVIDIDFTPNRGDCLSLVGLSRDLKFFFGNKDVFEFYEDDISNLELNFVNLSPKDCPKISFLEIEIENEISQYNSYLENYFSILENNKTNFFTDISNYLSYEQGQPTHCFDMTSISNDIIFENKECNESFPTLLGSEIKLQNKNAVFMNKKNIISLAGIMGGKESACSTNTRNVLVECAYFNPEAIIGKTIQYNLNSEAAYKFERGVDIESHDRVLRRFIKIVQDHAKIKNINFKLFAEENYKERLIPIDVNAINSILGTQLNDSEYIGYLEDLGFISKNNNLCVPSYRHDITSQNDIAEEIARVIGYDDIKSTPINLVNSVKKEVDKITKIKNFFIKNGFTEVINFPFTQNKKKESIVIDNPIDSNKQYLRTSLKTSLLENLLYNERRQSDSIKLFEISDIYTKDNFFRENKKLGIIISGRAGKNYIDFSKKLGLEYLDQILNCKFDASFFNIEEIERNKIKTKRNDKIFYSEILIDDIPEEFYKDFNYEIISTNFIKYSPVSEYPASTRDFSFSITNTEKYNEVITFISSFDHQYLKESFIFDFYINNKIGEIKVGVRLIFQSNFKTLSDREIKEAVSLILKPILDIDGVLIPGLELN